MNYTPNAETHRTCVEIEERLRKQVATLREACEHVFEMIEVELYESDSQDQWHIAAVKLRAALAATTEQSK